MMAMTTSSSINVNPFRDRGADFISVSLFSDLGCIKQDRRLYYVGPTLASSVGRRETSRFFVQHNARSVTMHAELSSAFARWESHVDALQTCSRWTSLLGSLGIRWLGRRSRGKG